MRSGPPSPSPDTSRAPCPSAVSGRLAWLDVTRGLAACIVVAQHALEDQMPGVREFTTNALNLGQAGVTAFFFVSGFVIPFSLERSGSLATFWTSRFFRLYPLYWFALAAVLLLGPIAPGLYGPHFDPSNFKHVLINVTMIQEAVRMPNALGVFWTLGVELIFYGIVTVAFALAWNRRSLTMLVAFGLAVALLGVAAPHVLGYRLPVGGRFFYVLVAMMGTLVFRFTRGAATTGQVAGALAFLAALDAALCATFASFMKPDERLTVMPLAMFTSFLAGAGIFFGMFLVRGWPLTPFAVHLGKVSYSIYLLHPFVMHFVPRTSWPALDALAVLAATVGVATVTHEVIEKPMQAVGRKLAASRRAPATA